MGGGGLLIFYVTSVTCYKVHFVHFVRYFRTFCTILSRAKAVPLHQISKRAEIANKHVNC